MNYIKVIGTPLYQWETGRKIQITPLHKMHVNAVHFSNYGDAEALVVNPREENGIIIADIPNILLQSGRNIVIYTVNVAQDLVETLVECTVAVRNRAKPADYVYTEEEQYTVKAIVDSAVEKAIEEAKENGEFGGGGTGKDGFSPIVEITETTNGHTVSITDVNGTKAFDVLNGIDGKDGEPGKDGIDGKNGKDGVDGYTPQKGIDYFTPTDKTEMVSAVIASLPIYEGGVE